MITTTAAGRTWHYSHSIGRQTAEHNTSRWGRTGGLMHAVGLAVAPDDHIFILSRGRHHGASEEDAPDVSKRIGKTTIDEDHIGDFARTELTWPAGLAIASDGNVYCSDEYTNRISFYSPDSVVPFPEYGPGGESLGSWGEHGSQQAQLNAPNGIAFDSLDQLYVVDSRNDSVQKFSKGGEFLNGWGSSGSGDGQFNRPWGIAVDDHDDVYVADWGNNRVQKFSSDGTYLTSFGADPQGAGSLNHPAGVAVDGDGDVYVTDWGNRCVREYEPNGDAIVSLYGHALEPSKAAHYAMNRDAETMKKVNNRSENGLPKVSLFNRPVAITVYRGDHIIISDSQNRLVVYRKDRGYEEPNL